MSNIEKIMLSLLILIMVGLFGCASFQKVFIPTYVDEEAIEYSEKSSTIFTPYTSLWDAERIKRCVEQKHIMNQEELRQGIREDKLLYSFLSDSLSISIADATEFKNNLFSPTGTIGILFPALTGLGIGWLGISKPSDKKKLENGNV